ncbi:protein NO VEIN domain-containing protein [Streptomyces sp. NPDC057193]|uniref:protein NO VEIN domain-containing protein n=1 Tax=unclassified Streptomyces TaxID=2593676 RepID=UPI00363CF838
MGKPYDPRCTRNTQERHVEVKGTTGAATSVELTTNEVLHARDESRACRPPPAVAWVTNGPHRVTVRAIRRGGAYCRAPDRGAVALCPAFCMPRGPRAGCGACPYRWHRPIRGLPRAA